jgi:arsenite-transporting ATPase
MSGIDALLASLPAWTLVGGKGGVGKTTCAAALATRSAESGVTTLILSTDPAGALADVLGTSLTGEPLGVASTPRLFACQLDAAAARSEFLAKWADVLTTIIDRGTYLDRDDIAGLVDSTLPGIDETMALVALSDLADRGEWQRVVIDTAPTGHTLRLLALPDTFNAVIDLLDTMQGKHRFMVSALMHRYRPDEADAFLADLRKKVASLKVLLTDEKRTGVVLVSRPEPLVVAETVRYADALVTLGIAVRAVVVNAAPDATGAVTSSVSTVRQVLPDASVFIVRGLGVLSPGTAGIQRWSSGVRPLSRSAPSARRGATPRAAPRIRRPLSTLEHAKSLLSSLPPVVIVGGKGGVGKTTISCALALAFARGGSRESPVAGRRAAVLLVSTDPAPSIADALDQPVDDAENDVRDGCGLRARQIDATAAFDRWREEYQSRVDAAFDALLGPGMDAAHDRAVARQLFALAPPGIDELYALIWLGDALAEGKFERIVIDPAPTGHLIRLLEMPSLALEWTHRLLRLMLKYRELAGGGDLAAELLAFARRTRAVGELLVDPARAGVIVVALDEPIVRLEATRVIDRVRALKNAVPALIWNRARAVPAPLPAEPPVRQFVAAALNPPPVGVERLLAWFDDWRSRGSDGE